MSDRAPGYSPFVELGTIPGLLLGTLPQHSIYTPAQWRDVEIHASNTRAYCQDLAFAVFEQLRRGLRAGLDGELFVEAWRGLDEIEREVESAINAPMPDFALSGEGQIHVHNNTADRLWAKCLNLSERIARFWKWRYCWKDPISESSHNEPQGGPAAILSAATEDAVSLAGLFDEMAPAVLQAARKSGTVDARMREVARLLGIQNVVPWSSRKWADVLDEDDYSGVRKAKFWRVELREEKRKAKLPA